MEEAVTVWHFLAEDAAGRAVYHPSLRCGCFVHGGEAAAERRASSLAQNTMRGFLFADADDDDPESCGVIAGRDVLASGDQRMYETPDDAAADGVCVYLVTEASRPPRISDGMLVDWTHIIAVREDAGASYGMV